MRLIDRLNSAGPDADTGSLEYTAGAGKRTLTDRLSRSAAAPEPVFTPVQRRAAEARSAPAGDNGLWTDLSGGDTRQVHDAAAHGTSGAAGTLPYADAIQRSFGGHDVSQIQAYTDGAAAEGARTMGAEAFASGSKVAFAGAPTLHTAAHEAAHVVQQRGGVHLKGGVGEVGDPYEAHADAVADLVVQGRSAEALLDGVASASSTASGAAGAPVQRMRDIATGGRVFEQADAIAKRAMFGGVIANLRAKLPAAMGTAQQQTIEGQIRKLEVALAKFDLLPNTEAFFSVMPEQQPADPRELSIDLEFGTYQLGDTLTDGAYQFVILVNDPTRVLMTKGGGHQSIAGDCLVYYAGTAVFAMGDLVQWNNDTGHYRTDVAHAPQAAMPLHQGGLPYLPMNRFVPYAPPAAVHAPPPAAVHLPPPAAVHVPPPAAHQ